MTVSQRKKLTNYGVLRNQFSSWRGWRSVQNGIRQSIMQQARRAPVSSLQRTRAHSCWKNEQCSKEREVVVDVHNGDSLDSLIYCYPTLSPKGFMH